MAVKWKLPLGVLTVSPPTPTARELEAKAAAGEQISLAALAGAIRADKERAKEAKPEKSCPSVS